MLKMGRHGLRRGIMSADQVGQTRRWHTAAGMMSDAGVRQVWERTDAAIPALPARNPAVAILLVMDTTAAAAATAADAAIAATDPCPA